MCTIGVTRLAADEHVLFKNKDFPRASFEDQIVVERGVCGIAGVATWSDPNPATDHFSGISVGGNAAGLLCADANVSGAANLSNYDELVEIALRSGGGVATAIAAIKAAVARQPYRWANLVMIDNSSAAALEVRGNEVAVTEVQEPVVRSNHHMTLDTRLDRSASPTTEQRQVSGQARLDVASTVEDVLELLRSHDDGDTGVCNHQVSQTVYSYVLRWRRNQPTLLVIKGHPCRGNAMVELTVPIGELWSERAAADLMGDYPSNRISGGGDQT